MVRKNIEFSDAMESEIDYIHKNNLDHVLEERMMDAAHEVYIDAKTKEYENKLEKLKYKELELKDCLKSLNILRERSEMEMQYAEMNHDENYSLDGLIKD